LRLSCRAGEQARANPRLTALDEVSYYYAASPFGSRVTVLERLIIGIAAVSRTEVDFRNAWMCSQTPPGTPYLRSRDRIVPERQSILTNHFLPHEPTLSRFC